MLWLISVTAEKEKCHSHHTSLNTLNTEHIVLLMTLFVIIGPILIIVDSSPIFEWFQSNKVTINREIEAVPR